MTGPSTICLCDGAIAIVAFCIVGVVEFVSAVVFVVTAIVAFVVGGFVGFAIVCCLLDTHRFCLCRHFRVPNGVFVCSAACAGLYSGALACKRVANVMGVRVPDWAEGCCARNCTIGGDLPTIARMPCLQDL